jgi:hypothetical protein
MCEHCESLYMYSFKNAFILNTKNAGECMINLVNNLKIDCTEQEVIKLTFAYTSLGELFETSLDENKQENFFNYLDVVMETDKNLFFNIHVKFINTILSMIRQKNDISLDKLIIVGCVKLLGEILDIVQWNSNFPDLFTYELWENLKIKNKNKEIVII